MLISVLYRAAVSRKKAMDHSYDIVVAGGGLAGLTAGLTAARLGRKTLVLTGDVIGGQLLSIEKIEGFPGFPEGVPGYDLAPMTQEEAALAGAEFTATELKNFSRDGDGWRLATGEGDVVARGLVLATGASLKELGLPGETRLRGQGVSHCASCDAPLLRGKVAAVIGGGDSAMQEALTLSQHVSRVVLLTHGAELTGQMNYRERVTQDAKIEVRTRIEVEDILGDAKVTGLRLREVGSGAPSDVNVDAVFVYIGLAPNTGFLEGHLNLSAGAIPTDAFMRTTLPGVCAAGTVRAGSACRAAGSAGDGATAAIAIDRYLTDGVWRDENARR
jgi:thioredoxin reductase (NADPH)